MKTYVFITIYRQSSTYRWTKGELINSISKVEIVSFIHNKQPINPFLTRLMNAVMN